MEQILTKQVVELCQSFIKIPSYSGREKEMVEKMNTVFLEYGFTEVIIDEYGSIIGKIVGNRPGPRILLDAHIDTVTIGEEEKWQHPPFGGVIEDEKIYGRGASDMKGALAAMIVAASTFAKEIEYDFPGAIYVAGVVHEECFEGVAARSISKRIKPDYTIIGEASELNIKCGQRGRAEVVVETYGKSAHSANPQNGVNAVYAMTKLIHQISKLSVTEHSVLGKGILELTDIISAPYPGASVVPDYCRATYDRRLLVGETKESVIEPIDNLIEELKKQDENFNATVKYQVGKECCYNGTLIEDERFFPGWLFEEKEDFVQKAYKAVKETGVDAIITQYSFCTNGSHYAGEAGIRTLGFGPSKENIAHIIDEYIDINQLVGACKGYKAIIEALQS